MDTAERTIKEEIEHLLDLGAVAGLRSAAAGFEAAEILSFEDTTLVIELLNAAIADIDKTGDLRRELGIELQ